MSQIIRTCPCPACQYPYTAPSCAYTTSFRLPETGYQALYQYQHPHSLPHHQNQNPIIVYDNNPRHHTGDLVIHGSNPTPHAGELVIYNNKSQTLPVIGHHYPVYNSQLQTLPHQPHSHNMTLHHPTSTIEVDTSHARKVTVEQKSGKHGKGKTTRVILDMR
ncbi:hypothetical protein BDZ45DRAFT_742038 [Acephala macrosclerotiorum]|nr:hypothetical protein BDZ45DRAFT_742038 [Acephala macrosclerotiorum]